jgi:hypothetical protein
LAIAGDVPPRGALALSDADADVPCSARHPRRAKPCARGRRGGGGRRARAFAEHRVVGVELAAERHGLLPGFTLALRHRVELGRDRLERRRLVVLRVDLEQLDVDLLALRILLERVLEDLLGLRVAAVGEIHLGFGDRIDLVRIDAAEALAAEVGGERVLARVDDAAARRAEHRVGLDVGAADDAVLELDRTAPARGDQRRDAGQRGKRAAANDPAGVLPTRSSKQDPSFLPARPWGRAPSWVLPPWAARRSRPWGARPAPGSRPSGARELSFPVLALRPSAARELSFPVLALRPSAALAPCPAVPPAAAGLSLERKRLLQVLQGLFELVDARLRFLQRLVTRHDLFGRSTGGALACLRRHLELVAAGAPAGAFSSTVVPIVPPVARAPVPSVDGAAPATLFW